MREADHGHDSAQEQVDLGILCKRHERPPIHQTEISMVEHDIRAKCAHRPVERLRRKALEEGIRRAVLSHTIDDIRPRRILFQHRIDRIDVILQICIEADRHIRMGEHRHKPCEQCILMSLVVREVDPGKKGAPPCTVHDQLPCPVTAAVIDKGNPTAFIHHAGGDQSL